MFRDSTNYNGRGHYPQCGFLHENFETPGSYHEHKWSSSDSGHKLKNCIHSSLANYDLKASGVSDLFGV